MANPWKQYTGPILDERSDPNNAPSITCPRCKRTSYNVNDIEQRYCGYCRRYHFEVDAVDTPAPNKPKLPRCWLGMWKSSDGKFIIANEDDINPACTCTVPIQAFMCKDGGLHECHKESPAEDRQS